MWLVKELAAGHRELGQDWQSDYRQVAERLEKSGETLREQLPAVTFQWLQQLAAEEQWESGRQDRPGSCRGTRPGGTS
jgi:hypothetical protein